MNVTSFFAAAMFFGPATSQPHNGSIDTKNSTLRVHVSKAGALSAFGHDHDIAAPIASGKVDTSAQSVELEVDARSLAVKDAKASGKDRAEIQNTMLGPQVLDSTRYPRIVFHSTNAERAGSNGWNLRGDLTLHGETRPIVVEVSERDGHYIGRSLIKQSDFGIKPVKAAGGAVRTKDEVRIEFDIQLVR